VEEDLPVEQPEEEFEEVEDQLEAAE